MRPKTIINILCTLVIAIYFSSTFVSMARRIQEDKGDVSISKNEKVTVDPGVTVESIDVKGDVELKKGAKAADITSSNGSVTLKDGAQASDISAENGSVELKEDATATGDIDAKRNITLDQNAEASGDVTSTNKDVTLKDGAGASAISAENGSVELKEDATATGDIDAKKNITIREGATADGDITTSSGNVSVDSDTQGDVTVSEGENVGAISTNGDVVLNEDSHAGAIDAGGTVELKKDAGSGAIDAEGNVTHKGQQVGSIDTKGNVELQKNARAGAVDAKGDVTHNGEKIGDIDTEGRVEIGNNAEAGDIDNTHPENSEPNVIVSDNAETGDIDSKGKVKIHDANVGDIDNTNSENEANVVVYNGAETGDIDTQGYAILIGDNIQTGDIDAKDTINGPLPVNDTASMNATEGSIDINVTENDKYIDVDVEGWNWVVGNVTEPSNGTAEKISGSEVKYTPNSGFPNKNDFPKEVEDSFAYQLKKENSDLSIGETATVVVTVERPDAPTASSRSIETTVGSEKTIELTKEEWQTVSINESPDKGSASVKNGTTISYIPASDFESSKDTDSFSYMISDDYGQSASATVNVSILPTPPAASDKTIETTAETSDSVQISKENWQTVSIESTPTNGQTVIDGSKITYVPSDGFAGDDSFKYKISDDYGQADSGTVSVTVDKPYAPTASSKSIDTEVGSKGSVTVNKEEGQTVEIGQAPQYGEASVENGNTLTYTPSSDLQGEEDSFTYTISDNYGQQDSATVNVTIEKPIEANDDYVKTGMNEDLKISALENDKGENITYDESYSLSPSNGEANIDGSNIVYTPNKDYTGKDTFDYRIKDQNGIVSTASITVEVVETVGELEAKDDSVTMEYDQESVVIDTLSNDQGPITGIKFVGVPYHGTASKYGNEIKYTPEKYYFGEDSFIYAIKSSDSQAQATVNVTRKAPEAEAKDDSVTMNYSAGSVVIDVLANDTWPFPEVTTVGEPSYGTAVKDGGKIKYTPAADYYGKDRFNYYLGNIAKGTVTVTIHEPKAVANDDSASMSFNDESVVIDVLANDSGPYTGIKSVGELSNGSAEKYRGQIKYTPKNDFYGEDSFVYKLSKSRDDYEAKATVNITVKGPPKLDETQKNETTSEAVKQYTDDNGNVLSLSQTDIGNETPMSGIDFSSYEQSYAVMAADKDLSQTKRDTYASISNKFDTLQNLRTDIANGQDKITEFNNTLEDVVNQIQNL